MTTESRLAVGTPLARVEGRAKVSGEALYSGEQRVDRILYGWIVQSQVARGRILGIRPQAALNEPGVIAVLSHENAPRLRGETDNRELWALQAPEIAYRGQAIACVVAETLETAREAAAKLEVTYVEEHHDVVLRADHPGLWAPETVNPFYPGQTERGDPDRALAHADVVIDRTYRTPAQHNNPMEPHGTLAIWEAGSLTLYDSSQGAPVARGVLARLFALEPDRVRVIAEHVGGGFGSKGAPRPQAVIAALAAQAIGRPVKVVVSRQQMFAFTGYRTPTIQRLALGARRDGTLTAIVHDAVIQTSTIHEFAEQAAICSRTMYDAANVRTTHRLVALDIPTPAQMRGPGETPGMFALESAIDELAIACDIDPVELRILNEPAIDPHTGHRWSSRNLIACLQEGAERFGWYPRDPTPRARSQGRWWIGTGVAACQFPTFRMPSTALARAEENGNYTVKIGAADIGTGARTVLTQIAADALDVSHLRVQVEIGDSALPFAFLAAGSVGTASWGSAVVLACRSLRDQLAAGEPKPCEAFGDTASEIRAQSSGLSRSAFGAQFAEVRVDRDTGEVRVPRLLGVFAAGRIINPLTARSQLIGGMTWGLSMALHEESVMDHTFGDYLNHDFAQYHIPTCADILDIDATWIDEDDRELNPMGSKGIGEIGTVGTAAAIANAVYHACGIRIRDLPITPAKLISTETDIGTSMAVDAM